MERFLIFVLTCLFLLNTGCFSSSTHEYNYYETSKLSIHPGSYVVSGKEKIKLYQGKIKVGRKFKENHLGINVNLNNKVSVINVLPSIDTPACEAQTHLLSESMLLAKDVHRVVISRDLPMAQTKFVKAEGLSNLSFYSDYKYASFGKWSGLLMKGEELLTRAVIVVDKNAIVRHMQIVRDVQKLPNMKKAFKVANKLVSR